MSQCVLIVDDEPNIVISLEFLLKREGFAVSLARDGEEGLAAIRAQRPDLVVLDVMMPKLDGYAVLQAVRADPELAATRILKKSLNVRQTEELVASLQRPPGEKSGAKQSAAAPTDPHLASLQNRLQQRFGTKVRLHFHQGKGAVEIQFFSNDDFERFLKLAGIELD